ncbi:hypothetical protein B0T26DRAFT_429813 [Lasiosphaeria miniovina]|uniref:Uncharacterized protein n=1 Tax=Lasiosphaeria miniovina TaxID=1954250 RepID=A0AA40A630_9PEZI|nr:uncharacterized protein B0T26DRAFT_429813 [Lasiosphaeria miniovina]KAK0709982.1 hypothetical protein B0T26DRAFT_429813 [Lasiosphaeria miniovina]
MMTLISRSSLIPTGVSLFGAIGGAATAIVAMTLRDEKDMLPLRPPLECHWRNDTIEPKRILARPPVKKEVPKTYSTRDSLVATHPTTSLAVRSLVSETQSGRK